MKSLFTMQNRAIRRCLSSYNYNNNILFGSTRLTLILYHFYYIRNRKTLKITLKKKDFVSSTNFIIIEVV